jgi:hypothetical protein
MTSTKLARWKPGTNRSRTSALTLPNVVSGPYPTDAFPGHAVAWDAAGLIGTVYLEASAFMAELLAQAEVVEHRPDVRQFLPP